MKLSLPYGNSKSVIALLAVPLLTILCSGVHFLGNGVCMCMWGGGEA